MADQKDKGILQISYNILNLPGYVKFDRTFIPRFDGDFHVNTKYLYRADGTKLRKTYTHGSGINNSEASTITEYLDGFQYEMEDTGELLTSMPLKFVPTSEGYYNFENNKYIYSYTDHLGNVRLSYTKNGSGTEIIEENNFYPFGMKHEGYNQTTGNPSYSYGYNGKELQKETGWSDFGARMYMSDIGRWGVIDPLAETSRRFNPYNYAYNNPVMFIDPDGRKAKVAGNYEAPEFYSGSYTTQIVRKGVAQMDELMKKLDQMEKDAEIGSDGGGSSPTEIGIYGAFAQAAFDLLKESMKGQLNLTFKNGIVSGSAVEGATLSEAASWLLEAIKNPDIKVRLDTVAGFYFYDPNKKDYVFFEGDAFRGSFSSEGKVITTNIVSPEVSKGYDIASGSPIGTTVLHAALEGYFGGKYFPNTMVKSGEPDTDAYIVSHFFSSWIDTNYKDLPNYYKIDKGTRYSNGVLDSNEAKIIDSRTQNVIYTFPKFKYSK